jgi:NADH-quinone oxidoreductase subunit N
MSMPDLFVLLPLIVIAGTALTVMLVITLHRNHRITLIVTLTGLALSIALLPVVSARIPRQVTPLLIIDHFSLFYMGLIFSACLVVATFSLGYLERREGLHEEFSLLLLLATLGSAVLVASSHFVSFFLGLEILSISLYALIAYLPHDERGIEAGIKYLILAGLSAAFLLFGMALIYAELGTMELGQIVSRSAAASTHNLFLLAGLGMVVAGIGFKLAVVPFHLWTPDVYEGAPAPVTAFVATVSKGSLFGLLLRYFTQIDLHTYSSLFLLFTLIALSSMFVGNLLALMQNNIKRVLAYSSIAHLGYLLVAFLASGPMRITAVTYYLAAYFVTTLGAFGVITVLSGRGREADSMDDYQGLSYRRPWLAGVFTVMLFSLAGIPLTAGFVGKFYILTAGVGSALWLLVMMLVINSAIGLFYYLRIIAALYLPSQGREHKKVQGPEPRLSRAGGIILALLTLLLLWMGMYPAPFIEVIEKTAVRLI